MLCIRHRFAARTTAAGGSCLVPRGAQMNRERLEFWRNSPEPQLRHSCLEAFRVGELRQFLCPPCSFWGGASGTSPSATCRQEKSTGVPLAYFGAWMETLRTLVASQVSRGRRKLPLERQAVAKAPWSCAKKTGSCSGPPFALSTVVNLGPHPHSNVIGGQKQAGPDQ